MAKNVPSSKDEKNVNVLSKNEQLPLDNQGNIDWVQYYQKMTPQIDQKEFEELKKQRIENVKK